MLPTFNFNAGRREYVSEPVALRPDEIIILEEGRITERGTHDELLRNRGYYYETYCLQQGITDAEGGEA